MKIKSVDDDYESEIFCLIISSQVLQTTSFEMEMSFMSVGECDKTIPYSSDDQGPYF